MSLRLRDKIGIAIFLIFQALLYIYVASSALQYVVMLVLQIILGIAFKLFNMYRMEPMERVQKKRDEGLSGLFC